MSNVTAKKAFTDVIKHNKRLAAELESLRAVPDVDDWKLLVAECYQHGIGVRGIAVITGHYNAMAAKLAGAIALADLNHSALQRLRAELITVIQRADGLEVERNALHETVARLMLDEEPKA